MTALVDVSPGLALSKLRHRLKEIEQIGDISLRIIEYRRLFEAFPGASLAAFNLAVDLWNNGQHNEARDAARRAVAIAPELLYRLPFDLAALLREERTTDNPFERLGQTVAGFRITHCIAEDPRTLLYQVERGLEHGYLRVLRRVLSQDSSIATQFLASASMLERISHPALVAIAQTGTLSDGCAYIAMRPEPGELLSERIRRDELLAPLAPALCKVADALATLHAQRVCYLGIQPERLQSSIGGAPMLQLLDSEQARDRPSQLPPVIAEGALRHRIDPVLFTAPELFGGQAEVGPAADVYGLGVLAYFMLCEHPPFQGERQSEVVAAHRNQPVPPLRTVAPEVPGELARLVEAMLDKDPGRRPAMARIAGDLTRLFAAPAVREVPAPAPSGDPEQLGDYRLVRKLAEGPTGQVFEAYNDRLKRRDAIKLIRPELSRTEEQEERFLREIQAANQLGHPGIVAVIQHARAASGQLYTVMEYFPGGNLRDRIARGALPAVQVQQLALHIAQALAAAHEHGVIHGDLRPENVLVVADPHVPGGERTKLLDFGTVHLLPQGGPAGAPSPYAAPEQLRDVRAAVAKSDVLALGVMMSEMLAGGWPGPAAMPAGCPKRLWALIQRMRDPDPNMRPSMQYLTGELTARPPPPPWRWIAAAAAISGLVAIALIVKTCATPELYALTVASSGAGVVTGVGCGTSCDAEHEDGTVVVLTATPTGTAIFGGWTGCDETSGTTCTITMNAAKTAVALFLETYPLAVATTGSGTVSGGGLSCGRECSKSYPKGTVVTLTAGATSPAVFGRWTGCEPANEPTCKVTINEATHVTASFIVTPPPPELVDVTGTVATTYTTDRGDIRVPQDLTRLPIEALVLDGDRFTHIAGSSPKPGSFEIAKVPPGTRYLRVGNIYLVTQATQRVDLGSVELGRDGRVIVPAQAAEIHFKLTGLEPVEADDYFQIVSPDVKLFYQWKAFAGQRDLEQGVTFNTLIEAARNDRVFVTQLATRTSATGAGYWALSRAYAAPPFSSMVGKVSLGPASMTAPPEVTRTLRWLRAGFDQVPVVHPAARLVEDWLFVSAYPLHPTVMPDGITPDLMMARRTDIGGDVSFGEVTFGNPFPRTWTLWVMHRGQFEVLFDVPGAGKVAVPAIALQWEPLVAEGAVQEVKPRVAPIQRPSIGNADARVDRTAVGTTPVLSWEAPRVGAPIGYCVEVLELATGGGKPVVRLVASLYTVQRSLRLPDGLLSRGKQYTARISALAAPGDLSIRPLKLGRPFSRADALTARFSP